MSTATLDDTRILDERIHAEWTSARGGDLPTILEALYRREINCGMQSFWDGGWDVWIGDQMNGRSDEENFAREASFEEIAEWLYDSASRRYPLKVL